MQLIEGGFIRFCVGHNMLWVGGRFVPVGELMSKTSKQAQNRKDKQEFDETLRKMLNTPPKPRNKKHEGEKGAKGG